MLRPIAFSVALLAVVSTAAAREESSAPGECDVDWTRRLTGRSVEGVNVWDGTRIQAYLVDDTHVVWIQDGLPYVQNDEWSIRDCNVLCWELDHFDDLCSVIFARGRHASSHDLDTGERLFQWEIGDRTDAYDLMERWRSQRFNPLARISNWLL